MRFLASLVALLVLASCGLTGDDGVVDVAFIGDKQDLYESGLRLSFAGQHVRAATAEGLVSLDRSGQVVPAIAERWIVTDDGASYIFRLRDSDWPDGKPINGETVRDALRANIRGLQGTSLGIDLGSISEIRAMTGRVVEIRLSSPMPDFLQLLAQPELGLRREGSGTGPMTLGSENNTGMLYVLPPEARGLPRSENWEEEYRPIRLWALSAGKANAAFAAGDLELVLGGQLADLPLANTGALARGTVRLESSLGLFGLDIRSGDGFLGDPANREALALAVNRETLLEPFNIAGWIATTRYVAPGLPGDTGQVGERWATISFEERQAIARRRVTAWKGRHGGDLALTIELPAGPGSDTLFQRLGRMYGNVGITLVRAKQGSRAQLALKDRSARYGAARWFLNQFNCQLTGGLCSPEADHLLAEASRATDPTLRAKLFANAERQMMAENWYVPFGAPIRWSLVRGGTDGFSENAWGIHPLFSFAGGTT